MTKYLQHILVVLFIGTLVACSPSEEDKAILGDTFGDLFSSFAEEEAEEVSTTDALTSDYIADEDVEFTTGSAKLAGVVAVSQITPAQVAAFNQAAGIRSYRELSSRAVTSTDVTVYWIDGTGNKTDVTSQVTVEVFTPASGDPQFIVSNVKDGLNYVVEIEVNGATLKNLAYVPPGATKSAKIEVSPKSTVVTEVVEQKVKASYFETGGDSFSQNFIEDVTETVAAAVETVIADSDSGITLADLSAALDSEETFDAMVSEVITNEVVSDAVEVVKKAAVAETFEVEEDFSSNEDAWAVIDNLFAELMDDEEGGGAPGYIIKAFGDAYYKETTGTETEKTVANILGAIYQGVEVDADAAGDNVANYSSANALAAFKSFIREVYIAIEAGELVDDVPDVILGIFPASELDTWKALDDTDALSVPQAVVVTIFVVDQYLADLQSYARNQDGDIEKSDGYDFNPGPLLELYGFTEESLASSYSEVSVNYLGVNPNTYYDEMTMEEKDILSVHTCVEAFGNSDYDISSVSLTYPKDGGTTGSVDLKSESELWGDENGGGGGHECYLLDPWAESHILSEDDKYRPSGVDGDFVEWGLIWADLAEAGLIVSDYASGDYTVTVTYDETDSQNVTTTNTAVLTVNKLIIKGMQGLRPKLTYPVEEPQWPGPGASEEQWTAFNEAQANFSMTSAASGVGFTVKWDRPVIAAGDLPEGIVPVYELSVGREVCSEVNEGGQMYNQCHWDHIFATWEEEIRIFGNSFTIPRDLPELGLTDRPYSLNIDVQFMNEFTGELVGRGGHSHAPFRIGAALDLSGTFNLVGEVLGVPETDAAKYKVALVKESCSESQADDGQGGTYTMWTCSTQTLASSAIANDAYSLEVTMTDVMNIGHEAWLDTRVYFDEDGDDMLDADPSANDGMGAFEPMWWANNNIWFNSWGGLLYIESDFCVVEGQDYCEQWEHQSEPVFPSGTVIDGSNTHDGNFSGANFNLDGNTDGFKPGEGGQDDCFDESCMPQGGDGEHDCMDCGGGVYIDSIVGTDDVFGSAVVGVSDSFTINWAVDEGVTATMTGFVVKLMDDMGSVLVERSFDGMTMSATKAEIIGDSGLVLTVDTYYSVQVDGMSGTGMDEMMHHGDDEDLYVGEAADLMADVQLGDGDFTVTAVTDSQSTATPDLFDAMVSLDAPLDPTFSWTALPAGYNGLGVVVVAIPPDGNEPNSMVMNEVAVGDSSVTFTNLVTGAQQEGENMLLSTLVADQLYAVMAIGMMDDGMGNEEETESGVQFFFTGNQAALDAFFTSGDPM